MTHGPDPPPPPVAAKSIAATTARAPVCQSANPHGNYYTVAVIASPSDVTPNKSDASLRSLIQTMDGVLYDSAVESGSPNGADYVFLCDSSGAIVVKHETLPTHAAQANFSTIVSDLSAKGYTNANEKYSIWYDDGSLFAKSTNYCGQAGVSWDESAAATNYSNSGPSYSITYDDDYYNCGFQTIMHELGHNLGAVQYNAPYSTGAWHCWEGHIYVSDTMCYNDGGSKDPGYLLDCGSTFHFDCNHNDYFDAKIGVGQGGGVGTYLDTHWNIGGCYVRFIVNYACFGAALGASPSSVSPGGTVGVSWSGVATPSGTDWIGLYHPGDADATYIQRVYDSSCTQTAGTARGSGSCSFVMPGTAGTYEFRLFANNGYGLLATSGQVSVVAAPAPAIGSFSPTSGAVGTSMTISGSNFTGATAVKFSGTASTFTVKSSTQITATVPLGATTGAISVTTPAGTGTSTGSFKVLPQITGFNPTTGLTGTSVVIAGTSLTGASSVKFNGTAAIYTVNSNIQITATVPGAATSGQITVTTAAGTAKSSTSFAVKPAITSFSPSSAKVGVTITITGSGLKGTTSVKFNGVTATFNSVQATSLKAVVPAGATSGSIVITTAAGTATSPSAFTVLP